MKNKKMNKPFWPLLEMHIHPPSVLYLLIYLSIDNVDS